MSEVRTEGWVLRLARSLGFSTAFSLDPTQAGPFVFVLAASGVLASLTSATIAGLAGGRADWNSVVVLLVQGGACGAALAFLRAGRSLVAAWTLMLTGVIGTTVVIFTGNTRGLDDVAITLYAVLAITASVLFDSKNFAIAQTLVVMSLVSIVGAELAGGDLTEAGRRAVIADGAFVLVIAVVTGVAAHFLAARLRRTGAERERHKRALEAANLELESRALEREELIEELEMRNSELERFAYTVSHELKSPLVTIGGFLPYLTSGVEAQDRESIELSVEHIRSAHDRMSRLLAELLELCRLGFLQNPAENVWIADLVEEARQDAGVSLSARDLRITIAPDLPAVCGDRHRLVEVFQNLLENAARFTRDVPQPEIEVGVRRDNGEAVVFVADNGVGIDPSFHEKIFDLFHKLDPADQGTGVGLAIVRRIVELHGGRIWVESAGVGQGSTFCLTLPWVPEGIELEASDASR